jgi:hypothetical protein
MIPELRNSESVDDVVVRVPMSQGALAIRMQPLWSADDHIRPWLDIRRRTESLIAVIVMPSSTPNPLPAPVIHQSIGRE